MNSLDETASKDLIASNEMQQHSKNMVKRLKRISLREMKVHRKRSKEMGNKFSNIKNKEQKILMMLLF